MSGRHVVKRYARALYEAAELSDQLETVTKDVLLIDSLINESIAIKQFCERSYIKKRAAKDFIYTAFIPMISAISINFIKIVVDNNRLALLPLLNEAFTEIIDQKKKRERVVIEVTEVPDKTFLKEVENKMSKRITKEIQLEYKVNKKLVKGFRLFWRNRLIDNSVAGRLRDLRTNLKEGAAKKYNE